MSALSDATKEVVTKFLEKGIIFSSGDVSNEVKRSIPSARHGDVATQVRILSGSFLFGNKIGNQTIDYNLTTIYPVNIAARDGVCIYHPRGQSIAQYKLPNLRKPRRVPVVFTKPDPTQFAPQVQMTTVIELARLKTEAQGRIRIPRNIVDQIRTSKKKVKIEASKNTDEFILTLV